MIIDQIRHEIEELLHNYEEFETKHNKAAGGRARKAANNLKKLMTPFKREVMDMAKKMKKKK